MTDLIASLKEAIMSLGSPRGRHKYQYKVKIVPRKNIFDDVDWLEISQNRD
jgi:hypothetical protein